MTRLMQGFPPTAAAQVTLANWRQAPFSLWAFQHVRELVPSADIPNAEAAHDVSAIVLTLREQRADAQAVVQRRLHKDVEPQLDIAPLQSDQPKTTTHARLPDLSGIR
jgi:hypothetical protein